MERPLNLPAAVVPVVLCGGSGSRLWPLSRRARPKQLLPLATEQSLLMDTLLRCASFGTPWLIGADAQRFLLAEAVRRAGAPVRLLCEPEGRDTAAAALAAAFEVQARTPDSLVLLLPADHRVDDTTAFHDAVHRGTAAATQGNLVVFGITPDRPHTGYGYIAGRGTGPVRPVDTFVEKPDLATAEAYVARGFLWNAGMFLFRPDVLIAAFAEHAPEIYRSVRASLDQAVREGDFVRLETKSWRTAPKAPLDRAIMEKTTQAVVVPVSMGWTDLGSYDALYELGEADGNATVGDVLLQNCTGCYVHAEDLLVTARGVEDLVVVGTRDAVLVTRRGAPGEVKHVVSELGERVEVREHPRAERPWGNYRSLDHDDGFQVKRIEVRPGQRLSLQRHRRRSEHWVIVRGQAEVRHEDEILHLSPGGHVRIDIGDAHQLENIGTDLLVLIEVQLGDYLGEDDIERLEDQYGRCSTD